MNETHTEVLSAFCDGEAVDPAMLALALADPHARDALVDFARLRAAVALTAPLPESLQRRRRAPVLRRVFWPAAAAIAAMLLVIVMSASLLLRVRESRSNAGTPPVPTRVVRYVPGVDWHPEGR